MRVIYQTPHSHARFVECPVCSGSPRRGWEEIVLYEGTFFERVFYRHCIACQGRGLFLFQNKATGE